MSTRRETPSLYWKSDVRHASHQNRTFVNQNIYDDDDTKLLSLMHKTCIFYSSDMQRFGK